MEALHTELVIVGNKNSISGQNQGEFFATTTKAVLL